ncbi:hypothetical protein JCM18918_810 [Cutibacterium acnes JCM 18918]|nr:hypothetical protein JCM18918_810 [Cutibacterium acnes JCM 18918]
MGGDGGVGALAGGHLGDEVVGNLGEVLDASLTVTPVSDLNCSATLRKTGSRLESVHTKIEPVAPAAEELLPDDEDADVEGESLLPHADRTPMAATLRLPRSIERRVMSDMGSHLSRQLDPHRRASVLASGGHFVVTALQADAILAKSFMGVQSV